MIINQIESENGLIRRYMKADLKGQMLLYERGYSTRENVIRGVRTDAFQMAKWSSRNVIPAKVALGVVFALLGVLILITMLHLW